MHVLIPIVVGVISMAIGWWLRGLVFGFKLENMADQLEASNDALAKVLENAKNNLPANVAGTQQKGKV